MNRVIGAFVLCLFSVVNVYAQTPLTQRQRVEAALEVLGPVDPITSTGDTNIANIRSRLKTLLGQVAPDPVVECPVCPPQRPQESCNADGSPNGVDEDLDGAVDEICKPVVPPTPVDCVVSAFTLQSAGPWGSCVNNQQTRTETWARTVITQPSGGGAACPALTEQRTATQSCTVEPPPTGTLRVNSTTGDDALTIAQVRAGGSWRSLGRAVWGSTNRATPNASEAARAGDVVSVAGGTYSFSGTVNNRFQPVYNAANNGAANQFITFSCIGVCRLTGPNANSPAIGGSGKSFIKWFADERLGHTWDIRAYAPQGGSASADQFNTTPDTGPVVCHTSTSIHIEGVTIDGGPPIDYADNHNAVRIENCTNTVVRNVTAANFDRVGGRNHNQSIVTLYGSLNGIFEHIKGTNAGACFYFKDIASSNPQSGNHIRYSYCDRVGEVIAFSITSENRNFVYQNIGTNGNAGFVVVGGGLSNDWVFNNTFYRMSTAGSMHNGAGSGGRFQNNICVECGVAVAATQGAMPATTVVHYQNNVYFTFNPFYNGSDGNRTLAAFRTAYPGQEQNSIDANPLFVNAAGGDFHLATTSPARTVGVDLQDLNGNGSTTDTIPAGAFVLGTETIGPQVGAARVKQ